MIKRLLYLLPLTFAAPAIAQAQVSAPLQQSIPQGNARITGTVLDANTKAAVEFATVALLDATTGKVLNGTIVDEKGNFILDKLTAGKYKLQVSFLGYQQKVVDEVILASDKGEVKVDVITLTPDAKQLKEVVITGQKPLIEEKVDRLVYNADQDISTKGGTAADVLRNVPMLTVDGDGNVQMRGSSNIMVLINNRPSSIMAGSVADAVRQIPADVIKSVEVITSPSAKYDAEGTAGVINIITKKNTLQGVTGGGYITPGNVSTIGNANLNYRQKQFGINSSIGTNQFYNNGTTLLERLSYVNNTLLRQSGKTRNRSGFINPALGFDVDLNERNSLGGGVRFNSGYNYVKNDQQVTESRAGDLLSESDVDVVSKSNSLGYDLNLDYLRTFKKPQQEFSILTLYSKFNADNQANQDAFNEDGQLTYLQRNLNESQNEELTLQTDYIHPFENKTMLELGAKTIQRFASSDVSYFSEFPQSDRILASDNIFSYNQDVYAGYFTYGFQVKKKLNVKVGARYEQTAINADFKTQKNAFETDYENLIPSVALSYTLKEKHTFRANYTQRIQRPQLFFLNPYEEAVSPNVIQKGNPELDPELTDLYDLSYGTYNNIVSFNLGLFARITDNAITTDPFLRNDTTVITFQNIARNTTYGVNVYGSVKPKKGWTVNSNVNLYHASLNGNNLSNSGWMYNINSSTSIELGKGWVTRFNGSFNSRRVTLQGKMASFYYHNMTLRKEILNKRGGIGINLANPFMKGTRVRNDLQTATFEQMERNINFTRGIRGTLEFRFGKLEQNKAPRRAKKSISNDDALRGQ
ncbi:TonB-dependent receptor domain-containing protein [Pontibacter cellulosilyticus]|uniref:TonB-dependent receptor n=1 Tax=Pontibacter cellulosilyticus TaxID=1720253 RepID=A0A923N5A2_9BACT|nr:TonB-dependent receptor [Pontibacter cellulosilyticus]MBC5992404.1 TonB-dependent receptor [Pontibacter cellulosilyticus]